MTRSARGVALITALLVVAIASIAATALLTSANIAIHRTGALRDTEQGWWVARGVESWVLGILQADDEENDFDALGEPWSQPVDLLPVEHGFVRGHVVDLQGRFNLNHLAFEPNEPTKGQRYHAQFRRLLGALTEVDVPPGLAGAIRDWIDGDQIAAFPSGAEDSAYLNLTPAYRAANRPFTVVSELLAVHGMTPALYEALRELVAALPGETEINVNTAPEAVLRAMSETVDENKLRQFIERRVDQPAEQKSDFDQHHIFGTDAPPYGVRTRYFQIRGEVFVGSSRVALYSLIHRPDNGTPAVLAHSADAE